MMSANTLPFLRKAMLPFILAVLCLSPIQHNEEKDVFSPSRSYCLQQLRTDDAYICCLLQQGQLSWRSKFPYKLEHVTVSDTGVVTAFGQLDTVFADDQRDMFPYGLLAMIALDNNGQLLVYNVVRKTNVGVSHSSPLPEARQTVQWNIGEPSNDSLALFRTYGSPADGRAEEWWAFRLMDGQLYCTLWPMLVFEETLRDSNSHVVQAVDFVEGAAIAIIKWRRAQDTTISMVSIMDIAGRAIYKMDAAPRAIEDLVITFHSDADLNVTFNLRAQDASTRQVLVLRKDDGQWKVIP